MASGKGLAVVLGAPDTGKTSFCLLLANQAVQKGLKVGLVDADVGQSDIGPPTTIGLGMITKPVESIGQVELAGLYFVGSNSPEGHIIESVVGTKCMADKAVVLGAELVIVDTTGLVYGTAGRKLKENKINLLQPNYIIGLQNANEIEHLLYPYEAFIQIHRLPVPKQVTAKSREQRRARRQSQFLAYFEGAKIVEFPLDEIVLSGIPFGAGPPLPGHFCKYISDVLDAEVLYGQRIESGATVLLRGTYKGYNIPLIADQFKWDKLYITSIESLENLVLGLINEKGEAIGIGILKEIDFKQREVKVYTPIEAKIKLLKLGSLKLLEDGTEVLEKLF